MEGVAAACILSLEIQVIKLIIHKLILQKSSDIYSII